MPKKKNIKKKAPPKKDIVVKLDMGFEAAMKKALNTPLPKKKAK
jgi:hypothetical protein